jgi:hypothetical protein
MDAAYCIAEREQFQPLLEWVDVDARARSTNTVIELSRVATAGRAKGEAMRDLVRMPPRAVLPPARAAAKAPATPAKPQLPAWLSRISQRFVE